MSGSGALVLLGVVRTGGSTTHRRFTEFTHLRADDDDQHV